MMEFTAEMIAGFLGGEVVGDKNAKVHTVSSIEGGKAGSLAYLTNPKYEPWLYTTQASIVLVNRSFEPAQPVAATLIKVDDAYGAFAKLLINLQSCSLQSFTLPFIVCIRNSGHLIPPHLIYTFSSAVSVSFYAKNMLNPEDRWLIFYDRKLDGSGKDKGYEKFERLPPLTGKAAFQII